MERPQTTVYHDAGPMAGGFVNAAMRALVDELVRREPGDGGAIDPLHRRISLVALQRRLARLTRGLPIPHAAGGRLDDLLADFLAELRAEEIPCAETALLRIGLVWADLCTLAGEEPPRAVAALLDEPACAG